MVLALYPFESPIRIQSLALCVAGGVLAVAAASTCVELGFAKLTSSDEKAVAPGFQAYSPASAMAVLFTFSAAGAFAQVGVGYIEAHFQLIAYGEPAAYYGWNCGALVLLALSAVWLGMKGSVTQAKFVAVVAAFTFAITVILRQVSRGYYSIYSQESSWLTIIVQVFILELGHLHTQGLWSWTRWALPTSESPPAVYHQHGSATGAFPGVEATSISAERVGRIGSMTGMVIGGANKDEVLDAFDVFRSSSLDKLYGLHCGPVLRKGQDPGEQIYRLPFQSGDADRKWSEFLKDLAPSIECMSNTGIPGKNSRAPVPGSKLFGAFQESGASEHEGARQFTQLGALLMHAQHSQSSAFGTCDVMVSSQTLRTKARPAATEEVLYKLSSGYNKRLWPVLHVDEPSENLVMPSDAADHASRKYLVGCLQKASSAFNSGDGASLLPGTDTRGSALWQSNSTLASLFQKLAQAVSSGRVATVICPRPALVSEKYMGTRMRMWGAISQHKDVIVTGSGTPRVFSPRKGPVDFVFFVDEKCEHVAEVLVHAWLDLHECSIEACLVGELLVGKASEEHTSVPGRLHQEIEETKPVDLLQALGRLAANGASGELFSAPSRQASSSLSPRQGSSTRRLAIQDGSASPSAQAPRGAQAFSRQYADKQADPTVQLALTNVLAEALQHRCFDYSIDSAWLSATHESWRTIISTAIHKNGMTRRLPAETDIPGAADAPRAGADTAPKTATQVLTVSEVVDRVCAWMQQTKCCTTGTLSVLRQVQRCSLELTLHSLLHAAVGLSEHGPKEFLSDSNIMVVYLEHMGIGNETENWYGMTKFRLGRILWNRYQDMRCDGESLVEALPPGKGIYDLEQDDVENMEAPTRDEQHDTKVADNMTGFSTSVGNGVFWLIPFIMYFVPLTLVGFSLYDNGNLSDDLRRWLFWSFFCAFLVVGGYFNLLLHFINNHRWRFSGQAQLLAIAQSIPSALIVFLVCAIPVGGYARLRSGWLEAVFSGVAFVCLSLELTMLMIVGSLTTDGNLWGSSSALKVIGVYCAQLIFNCASRFISKDWGEDVVVNLVALLIFAGVAGLVLIIQIRSHSQIWAEALQSGNVTDAKTISKSALQVLLSFHNAMYGKNETPDTLPPDDLALAARKAAQTLLTKTKVLRRQRLSIIFDKYCWVVPQGALMHMMITIPYWFGEWGGQGLLKDIYSNVLVMSLAYVISAGAFCEWCWIARQASLGLNQAQKRAMYIRTFGQLMWWCLLMAVICTAFLLLLMATPTWVDPTFGLGKVYQTESAQMSWFYLKLAGYTMMVFVRFDDIMGDTEPVARIDALHMFLALAVAIGCTVPLAKLKSFDAAPPTAVIVAGGVYLALHLVRKWMRQIKQARKDKQPVTEVYQVPLSTLIGQPAFSNSTFRQTDLRSALHRLQATKSKLRHKLKPHHKAGQEVAKLLQTWSEYEQPGEQSFSLVQVEDKARDGKTKKEVKAAITPAKDDALAVVDPTKEEDQKPDVRAPPAAPTTKGLLGDAFPDMMSMASTALDSWNKGRTEVWVVPFAALNTDAGAPQLYSLGVPHPNTGKLAVHVVASDVELDQIQNGGGEAASRRVAEALIFATSMTMLKATGQTSSMTLSRLDACMWENPESARSLQQRLADELAMLPAPVLSSMVDRGPLSLVSVIWQQLMGQYSAVGNSTWKDTDLFADMGPTAVEDAWQWLPLQARITLVHFLSQLPQLTQQLSNSSPESRQQLDDALQQLVEGAELTQTQRDALKVATELVVCGEEVMLPEGMSDAVALKQRSRPTDLPGSPNLLAAVHARPHFLAAAEATSESTTAAPTDGSPASPHAATDEQPAGDQPLSTLLSSLSFVGHTDASSLPRRVLRAYLAVEMVLEVQQAVKKQMQEGSSKALVVSKPSPSKAAPKAQKSHLALDITSHAGSTKPGPALDIAPVAADKEDVGLPGTDANLSAQHKSGLVVADSVDAEFAAAQKSAHLTVRKAINFFMQSSWRLFWLALMGDVSYWQEAMHLIEGRRSRFLHYLLFPYLMCLQLVAFASEAMYIYLCCYAIWDVGGVWSWLVVAQRKSISAIARYDAAGQVSHVLTISRQGFYHTYMSLVANSASQMQMQAPVNTTPDLDLPTSKKVLELARAVLGANFNANDSLYWCHTGSGMSAECPSGNAATSTAFVVRSERSVGTKGTAKRNILQSSGLQTVNVWLPIWQYSPEDKTSSAWAYETNSSTWPQQKLTWTGVASSVDAHHKLAESAEPDMITSYSDRGRVSAISTRLAAAKAGGADSKSLVGFHLTTKPLADEAGVRGAGCKIETLDESGAPVMLQVDLHFFYPVTMVAGKASRVAYRPLTPDPEHPKALLLPFAAQLHITVAGHDPAWQYLLVRTKPPGLLRKSNYLWPSNSQDTIDCWLKTDAKSVWEKCPALPEWLGSALGALDVPWAPSAWQELPALPAHLRMSAARNSVQLHTLKTADTGLSRMLLWWMWKMGAAAVNDVFYPAGAQAASGSLAQGLGALKSLFQSGARPIVATSVPVLDGLSATTMDEALLRGEPLLFWYWTSVAWLSYKQCQSEIAARKSTLQVAVGSNLLESGNTFSQLAHNMSSMGTFNTVPGNAYTMVTPLLADGATRGDSAEDPDGSLHVVAVDSGTWPTDGGGVATCRELVLDYVQHVRWSVLSEIGNDFKQVQPGYIDHKTLDSVDLLIMWDGQYPTPAQNALAAVPYIDLSWRQYLTRATSIKHNFVPVLDVFLMVLLKSSFLSAADVQAFGEAIMQMWRYFQIYDWERTWASPQVMRAFFASLNAFSQATVGHTATDGDLFAAYDAVQHYMKFICMPKLAACHMGTVCHASNHGTQAMTGMIFKKLFNQALIVWDHCVYVRERLLWYDTEKAMPFLVRDTLARLHRAAAEVLYAEADLVTPCCATFNVDWEQWLGHAPETIMPVVNGLDFNTYKTVDRVLAERPTVVMMAHINPLKDIVTAIRAAKLIVEEYKVTGYQLLVYGNKRQDEVYCAKCERLIKKLGMQDHVFIMGLAKPAEILRQGWIYLQSSISEGLPISILEAGMSGLCVVCTDVGGCAETMSDGRRSFGRLTSARNHKMVAYGQMEVMAMLPTLSNPNLSQPPQVNPDALMSRLADPAIHEQRRMWGVEYKEFIKRKFSLFTHASQQRQAFYLTHYSRQICAGDTMPSTH
ncbi:hypothetical protein WJX77_007445 [Trebouxia sp. C0004]